VPENREQEPKPIVRRGRPPTKKTGRPPTVEHVTPDPSPDVVPSNVRIGAQAPTFLGQNLLSKQPGRPPAVEHVTPDSSPDVVPSNVGISAHAPTFLGSDLSSKQPDKAVIADPPKNTFGLRVLENSWSIEHRSDNNDDFLGQFSIYYFFL
jgi:hypothetical protein